MITIIDYGAGNIRSVYNAFKFIGEKAEVVSRPKELKKAEKIVLPGVGSSKDAMRMLGKRDILSCLKDKINEGTVFLGICLGMQLLFEYSEESGGTKCFNLVKGTVKKFRTKWDIKVPQIGWNTVEPLNDDMKLFKGIEKGAYFYFVHSYFCPLDAVGCFGGISEYGVKYASMLVKDNIFAVQFHPERSQANGLKMLKNFANI